jgi:hypothetical protein
MTSLPKDCFGEQCGVSEPHYDRRPWTYPFIKKGSDGQAKPLFASHFSEVYDHFL